MPKSKGQSNRSVPAGRPVVFHFQPKSYFIMKGDKLHVWEEWMRLHVGLPVPKGFALRVMRAKGTCTGTNTGDGGADDCDK